MSTTPNKPPDVGLVLAGDTFRHFTEIDLTQSIDSFSTAAFTAPFEADRAEFRKRFRPFSYSSINVLIDQKVRMTGSMMGPEPKIDQSSKAVAVTAYGLPAVLAHCCPPGSAFPLEFSGMTLLQIAQKVCAPFGITARIDDTVSDDESSHAFQAKKLKRGPRGGRGKRGNKFARVALEPGDDVHGFLVGLAQQVGLVMSDDEVGNLVFRDSDANLGNPVARFVQGQPPLVDIDAKFSPESYFSEITGFTPNKVKKKGTKYTLKNPFIHAKDNILRPHCFKLDDTTAPDAPAAVYAKIGRMFGNMVSYTISKIPTWRDPSGKLWTPNTTVLVTAPDAMIYRETELLIRDVKLHQDPGGYTAELNVVLPGAFSGAMPADLPWLDP